MNPKMTETKSPSAGFSLRFMNQRGIIYATVSVWFTLMFSGPLPEAAALPTADEILQELHLSDSDRKRVRQGEIVNWSASEGSDRELAIGVAFLVKSKPPKVLEMFHEAAAYKSMGVITAHGQISGDGTLADFALVKLEPNGEKEARRYLEAEPGDDLNLDAKEMAAFVALKSTGKNGAVPVAEVETLIRQTLLSRYQAYRNKGLAGITPYERTDGHHLLASDELSLSLKELKLLAKYLPSVYDTLVNYPTAKIKEGKQIEEQFLWLNIDMFGRPLYVLSHRTLFQVGEAYVVVDRHYYTSHDYNSMLQGTVVLPSADGLLIIYIGRVSTGQVAGWKSAALHPVSRTLMSPYIKDMFEALRAEAKKQ